MTPIELLSQLRELNFTVSADDGHLILRGPRDGLPPALRTQLSEQKAEILKLLKDAERRAPTLLRRVPRDQEICLSFAQQRLWFLDQLGPGKATYNIPGALRLRGPLDAEILEQSLREIVRRHEALRTTFSIVGPEPVQLISPASGFLLSRKDLSHLSKEQCEQEALRLASEEARSPFDLASGPLFRATLIDLGTNDHMLLLTMHHIVSDGWSMGVLHRELSDLYRAFTQGKPSPLSELPVQYADYAIWQREWLTGEELEGQLSYWRKQLEGAPAVLNLASDRPRPAVQSFRGASQSMRLSKELSERLKTFSRSEGVTLFMTLLAAFQTLLHRYTGQEDIVVGSPIANRTRSEIEGLIGFFVNTLVLRGNFGGNPTFREFLAETRRVALDGYEHQDLPFEKLVEELKPERSLSYSPLFQVMFVLQNAPERALSFEGLSVSRVRTGSETAKFDLTLSVHETAQGLTGSLQYNTDLFEAATVTRLLKHFETLLRGIVDDPKQRISELPILTEVERRELFEWSETKQNYPKDRCLHQLFVEQATRTPEAIAVVFEGQRITYRELNYRANRLACRLQQLGVGPNILVGLCAERSIELIVGILGILKAGGAYVPLDPNYPADRLEFMLKDSHVSVVVSQKHLPGNFSADETTVVYLDTEQLKISSAEAFTATGLESKTQPDSLAYVIYTSGSTGNPKGVLVTHYNVVRLFQSTQAWFNFNASDVWTLFHSYAFDFSVWEIWGALLYGGKIVIVPGSVSRSPDDFAGLIEANGVTVLNQTPSAFRQLMPRLISTLSPDQSLRYVIFGGEALELQSLQPWFDRYGDGSTQLINMYGITETTVHVTYRPITRADIESKTVSVIGRPIPDSRVYILDPQRNLQPVGIPGEIYVGGAGVATGYLQRPQLMSERFIHDPFSGDTQARLYRSGDLARWLPNGELEYLGRIDNQIKIRGFRIEPGEIEAALTQHPQVKDAIVISREDAPGDKRLVAYVVAASDSSVSPGELRGYLQRKLPEYMVPSAFVFLAALPPTPNGKIDNKSLLTHGAGEPMLPQAYVPPQNFTESTITKIWQSVLGIEKIGVNDNFFDLGGHSLLAVNVVSQLNEFYKLDFKPRCLFESPTIAQLAERIRNGNLSNGHENSRWLYLVELQPMDGKRPVFFVPGGAGGEEDLLRCAPLLRRIGSGYSIYGLLGWDLRGATTVAKIAEEYLKEVRTVQPEGPYFLIGECISGIIAYEMAQQLIAQGQRVGSLTLLDTIRPTKRRYFSFQRSYYLKRLSAHRKHLQLLALREKMSYSLKVAKAVVFATICRNGNRVKKYNLGAGYDYDKILMSYSPQKYDFPMNLILSNDIYERRRDGGWADLVPAGINIVRSNGTHETYYTDYVDHQLHT